MAVVSVEDRKEWLRGFKAGTHADYNVESVTYESFINKELILFSVRGPAESCATLVAALVTTVISWAHYARRRGDVFRSRRLLSDILMVPRLFLDFRIRTLCLICWCNVLVFFFDLPSSFSVGANK